MDDFDDKPLTPEQRAQARTERLEDREHYVREERISRTVGLTEAAIRFGSLPPHEVPAFLREIHSTLSDLDQPAAAAA